MMTRQQRELDDVRYEVERGVAWITIARPERYNAFRGQTVDELLHCFMLAWADTDVGVAVLTGEGERAFCAGGDQKQRAETGDYGPTDYGLFLVEQLHRTIRAIPKPVIAATCCTCSPTSRSLPTTRCSARTARA
jgi:2-ketocyclohexanecarboxyl-CoA hydrolase